MFWHRQIPIQYNIQLVTEYRPSLFMEMFYLQLYQDLCAMFVPSSIPATTYERHGVSNHRHLDYLFNGLLRLTTTNINFRIIGPS